MNIKKKSIVAVGLTALSALALGIGVSVSGAKKDSGTGFMGSYDLTAYAEEATKAGVSTITVAGKTVDVTSTAAFVSTDEANAYTLCLTVIDLADFGEDFTTPLQLGYEIAEGTYYNGAAEGLSELVYSSITFGDGETTLSVKDLSLGNTFSNPYFIVAEVATGSVNSTVLNCIVAEKHNVEYVEGTPSTCAVAGNKAYYHCTDEGCDKYFTDSLGLKEIADLTAWKAGEGALELAAHTYLDGYEDEYCTVCHDHKTVVKDVKGVEYTLAYNTTDGVSRYFVASGKAADFNSLYSGKELILANEVGIKDKENDTITLKVPVTEIGESAFANYLLDENGEVVKDEKGNPKTGTADTAIKSVVVPKNITLINNLAFAYNYGMEYAVFLADTVNITGSFIEGEDGNNTPFYGCTTSSGATKTEMAIYFNDIIYNGSKTDLRWTRLWRFEASWLIYHRHFIGNDPSGSYNYGGGGTLYSNSLENDLKDYVDWSYVNLTVNNNTKDTYDFESIAKKYITEGVVATVYDAKTICTSVQAELDELSTTQEKCLKYVASVEISKDDFGTTQVVVDIDLAETTYYLLTLSSATTADDGSAVGGISIKSGDYQVYNGATYAANVTLTAEKVPSYNFAKYVSNGVYVTDNSYTFTLNTPYDVSVYYEPAPVTIKVISAVPFNHNGTDFESPEKGVDCVINKDNVNVAPTSTGYVFLGWAIDNGSSLEFTAMTAEEGTTYYAIWASDATLASATPTTSGTIVESTSVTTTDGTLYAWYTDNTFATQVTVISVDNTVLYARRQYDLQITFNYSNSTFHVTDNYTGEVSGTPIKWDEDKYSGIDSFIIPLLEGQSISFGYSEVGTVSYKSGLITYKENYSFAILTITEKGETVSKWAIYADNNKIGKGTMRNFYGKDSSHEFSGEWVDRTATATSGLSIELYV